ncbi:pyrroline-5-carboxylate reductase [Phragmitibacter flavus]|uniref:Pyrroline-5-carboxylate reductase n=1 Tax=Phragmitibacter flavus TaxID=2576071 RepID=A0A5R8KI21_9BACT|nr:pyrroline-5-carboxylate reductase [Phragmitibacter flavus]TLD71964.1 pyrroline-5-carboxylate reductase [Phragmitibacter flavus]
MKLGLIGCGKMGSALLNGVLAAGLVKPEDVLICDAYATAAMQLKNRHPSLIVVSDAAELAPQADVVILAVKPKDIRPLLENCASLKKSPLWLSIAAGITLKQLQDWSGPKARVIRSMPNTPAQIGKGYSAFAKGSTATDSDAQIARDLLGAVGLVDEVPEYLLDSITGLSGSGPAYVFTIIEALADGGVLMGLPRDAALRAAAQTVVGAAQMVIDTAQHPASLRDAVTSPGGTTIAGLEQLEKHGLRNALLQAVRKATERSRELAG